MTDYYQGVDSAWHIFGQTKYLHTRREVSDPSKETVEIPESDPKAAGITPETLGTIGGATIRRNAEKNGLEIVFDAKPGSDVLTWLHLHGYRWAFHNKVWYTKYTEDKEAQAREYLKTA
jgi:hypothetical protein